MKLKERHLDIMLYIQWSLFIIVSTLCIKGELRWAMVFLLFQFIDAIATRIILGKE